MKKYLITIILLLFFPSPIKAEKISGATITTQNGIVTPYNDLKKALQEAKEGDIINLADDYEYNGTVNIKENTTLIITNNSELYTTSIITNGTLDIIDGTLKSENYLGSGTIKYSKKDEANTQVSILETVSVNLKWELKDNDIEENDVIAYLGDNKTLADKLIKYIELSDKLNNYKLDISKVETDDNIYKYYAVLKKRTPISIQILGNSNKFETLIKDNTAKALTHIEVIWTVDNKSIENGIQIENGMISNPNKYMNKITIEAKLKDYQHLTTTFTYIPSAIALLKNNNDKITLEDTSDSKWLDNIYLNTDEITYTKKELKELNKKIKDVKILAAYKINLYEGNREIIDDKLKRVTIKYEDHLNDRIKIIYKNGNEYKIVKSTKENNELVFETSKLGEFIIVEEKQENNGALIYVLILPLILAIFVSIILIKKKKK